NVERRVHHADLWTPVERGDRPLEKVRIRQIVVGNYQSIVGGGLLEAAAVVADEPQVVRLARVGEPWIVERRDYLRGLVVGCVVRYVQPEVGERLSQDALDRPTHQTGSIERGDEHRHAGHRPHCAWLRRVSSARPSTAGSVGYRGGSLSTRPSP